MGKFLLFLICPPLGFLVWLFSGSKSRALPVVRERRRERRSFPPEVWALLAALAASSALRCHAASRAGVAAR